MITVAQLRAARGLLGWTQGVLASQTGCGVATIQRMEAREGYVQGHSETVRKVQTALEAAGVVFIESNGGGPGVRLKF